MSWVGQGRARQGKVSQGLTSDVEAIDVGDGDPLFNGISHHLGRAHGHLREAAERPYLPQLSWSQRIFHVLLGRLHHAVDRVVEERAFKAERLVHGVPTQIDARPAAQGGESAFPVGVLAHDAILLLCLFQRPPYDRVQLREELDVVRIAALRDRHRAHFFDRVRDVGGRAGLTEDGLGVLHGERPTGP